eukprot:TRINITY_DN58152_c0_g1_i1.p4 TRINITY_DN58152_c0_g1~~TRINITY_DN58152_c0_g1_i1.p4  ORF type:complete len:105 (+),score=17.18 TRINITY_DN58152_c0_g1_i1:200-514(+)
MGEPVCRRDASGDRTVQVALLSGDTFDVRVKPSGTVRNVKDAIRDAREDLLGHGQSIILTCGSGALHPKVLEDKDELEDSCTELTAIINMPIRWQLYTKLQGGA